MENAVERTEITEADWQEVKEVLHERVGDEAFEHWFRLLSFEGCSMRTVTLSTPTSFTRTYIDRNYRSLLEELWSARCRGLSVIITDRDTVHSKWEPDEPVRVEKPVVRAEKPKKPVREVRAFHPDDLKATAETVQEPPEEPPEAPPPLSEAELRDSLVRIWPMASIMKAVSKVTGVTAGEMRGRRRTGLTNKARQIFMYLARRNSSKSYPEIGHFLGRDHTSVYHGFKKISRLMQANDPTIVATVKAVVASLVGVPSEVRREERPEQYDEAGIPIERRAVTLSMSYRFFEIAAGEVCHFTGVGMKDMLNPANKYHMLSRQICAYIVMRYTDAPVHMILEMCNYESTSNAVMKNFGDRLRRDKVLASGVDAIIRIVLQKAQSAGI